VKRSAGFTLIELMIVVAIIAIIAAIAIPNLLSARLNANETAAIATLRTISTAQAQFQQRAKADVDNDGVGEFGFLRELSAATDVRDSADGDYNGGSSNVLNPAALSAGFSVRANDHEVGRSGYLFHMLLVGVGGVGVSEHNLDNIHNGPIDTDLAETTWCIYAFPSNYSTSGTRTFFCNQTGDITFTDDSAYEGKDAVKHDSGGAAFTTAGSSLASITGNVAIGTIGRDGNQWKQVN